MYIYSNGNTLTLYGNCWRKVLIRIKTDTFIFSFSKKIMDTDFRIHNLKVLLYLEFW